MAASSTIRQPRALVKVNGVIVPGWIDWETDNNAFYQADTFRVRFATSMLPASNNASWFSQQTKLLVEILAGFPANPDKFGENELQSLIVGQVDDLVYNPAETLLELSGRDLTADLIDAKTTEQYRNQTASEVAVTLAKRHNLTPIVIGTTTLTGNYYEIDHARLNSQRSEWDLLSALANEEGMAVYIKGTELHFEPKPQPTDVPYILTWQPPNTNQNFSQFGGTHISFSRNLTLAKDIIVTYVSMNSKTGKRISKTVSATHNKNTVLAGAAQPIGNAQTYQYSVPQDTPEGLLQKAQAMLKTLSSHELKMDATLPADNVLDISKIIKVEGTGTAFDTIYYPDSIVRSMSIQAGYEMHVMAKNHDVNSQLIS